MHARPAKRPDLATGAAFRSPTRSSHAGGSHVSLVFPSFSPLPEPDRRACAESERAALERAIAGAQRHPDFVKRDALRHPLEELELFGIKPTDTVVEIWPGGGYWTEILAPYLHDRGTYYVAQPAGGAFGNPERAVTAIERKIASNPAVFEKVMTVDFNKDHYQLAPAGSVDLVHLPQLSRLDGVWLGRGCARVLLPSAQAGRHSRL